MSPPEFVKLMGGLFRHKDYLPDHKWVNDKLSLRQLQTIKLEVAFICRPETAANTFFDVARDVPSFQKIYIQLLIGYKPRKVPQKLTATLSYRRRTKRKIC